MKQFPIVITSIYPDAPAIKAYIKKGYTVILIGDKKTPDVKKTPRLEYFSIEDQKKLYKTFAKILPTGHYARKNIGYLIAMKRADAILETDDDNFPYAFFPTFKTDAIQTTSVYSSTGFVNTYNLFSQQKKMTVWPRGFPLRLIQNTNHVLNKKVITDDFPIQQSLIDDDSDFDAIYRLTNNSPITCKKNLSFALAVHTYAPLNTQNTFWKKEAFLLMYIPSFVSSRVCDIYRGYIAQRLLWEMGKKVLFLSPSVYQKRNPHNFLHDFQEELPLYTEIEKFVAVLEAVVLQGGIEEKMMQLYRALIDEGLLQKKELSVLKQWISLVKKITK